MPCLPTERKGPQIPPLKGTQAKGGNVVRTPGQFGEIAGQAWRFNQKLAFSLDVGRRSIHLNVLFLKYYGRKNRFGIIVAPVVFK